MEAFENELKQNYYQISKQILYKVSVLESSMPQLQKSEDIGLHSYTENVRKLQRLQESCSCMALFILKVLMLLTIINTQKRSLMQ